MVSGVCSEVLLANIFLNFKIFAFVHKSIEKTQKYLNFWVLLRGFLCFKVEAPWNDCEPLRPRPKRAQAA